MIVDFTHVIDNGITSYTEDTKPLIEQIASIDNDGYEERSINIFTHTGTHIDSPRHMFNCGKYIDEYKLDELIGDAIILDFSGNYNAAEEFTNLASLGAVNLVEKNMDLVCNKQCGENFITYEDLIAYNEEISKCDFVILKTGWGKYWCKDAYLDNYPTLTIEAAKYLASFKLKAVGVDCISIGKHSDEVTNHKAFFDKDILIIENLCLDERIDGIFKIIVAPLRLKNSDGVPIRIFGLV